MGKALGSKPFENPAHLGGLAQRLVAELPRAVATSLQFGQQSLGVKKLERHADRRSRCAEPSAEVALGYPLMLLEGVLRDHLADGISNGLVAIVLTSSFCVPSHAALLSNCRFGPYRIRRDSLRF